MTHLADCGKKGEKRGKRMNDLISRQAAIDAFGLSEKTRKYGGDHSGYDTRMLYEIQDILEGLPSAQPDIIQCRNCKFASGDSRICMKFGHSPIGELDFCAWAERRIDDH